MLPRNSPNATPGPWHCANWLLAISFTCMYAMELTAAEPHQIRQRGRTLVEAENFSRASDGFPYAESCRECSGQQNLGFFWKNSWFEMELDVSTTCQVAVSLRASSLQGTKIAIQLRDEAEAEPDTSPDAMGIDIPQTGAWTNYKNTAATQIVLPAGKQTLRFTNLQEGAANLDYITFSVEASAVKTRPPVTAGPPINPLKGFNTGWWRNEDYASVGFQYLQWGDFEPKDNEFNWDYVEQILNREGTRGRHCILQFVVDWAYDDPLESNYRGPQWLLEKVGEHKGTADPQDPNSQSLRATRYNDPQFIAEASEAIEALLTRYKDDPRTFLIQVGVLGFWGEWHTFPRVDWSPTNETKSAILNAYLSNLGADHHTQVRYPDDPAVKPTRGIGYNNGSATLTEHGEEFGNLINEQELWRNGPVGGEWPPNISDAGIWKRFFQTDEGLTFLTKGHYSTMLPPEGKDIVKFIPNWRRDARFMTMHRRMGYNLQVTEVRQLSPSASPGQLHVEIDLHNAGIAPFYKNWDVQLGILGRDSTDVIDVATDLRSIGPGETVTISAVAELSSPNDNHRLGLRILQPGALDEHTNDQRWILKARNVYVVLSNEVRVVEGTWGPKKQFQGGWNILSTVPRESNRPTSTAISFPFQGSFRPPQQSK